MILICFLCAKLFKTKMRKISILLLAALSFFTHKVLAQAPKIEMSEAFDEPEGEETKVIQCTNGNTLLFIVNKRDGIDVTVYDKSRKQIAQESLEGKSWDAGQMKQSVIHGIYEMNGQLVIFLEQLLKKTPVLFRLILDPNTGKITDEQLIAEMPKYGAGAGYAMVFGHVDPKSFHVEKDPNSDSYAVVAFDGFAPEDEHRIEVIHYNGQHKEINRAFYDSPNHKYKYVRYLSMAVDGDQHVYLCTYDFNTPANGGKMSKVFFSRLNAGSKEVEHKGLELTQNANDTKGLMRYNAETKTYQLFTASQADKKNSSDESKTYRLVLTSIDPENMTIRFSKFIPSLKLSEYSRKHLDEKNGYDGMPQDIIVNKDNSVTILQEETEEIVKTSMTTFGPMGGQSGGGFTTSTHTTRYYNIFNVGVLNLDANGMETNGIVIPKYQRVHTSTGIFNHAYKNKNTVSFTPLPGMGSYANTGFFSFEYLNATNGNYVLFNDLPQNFDKKENEERKKVEAVTATNTVCYKLTNGVPEPFYLYGTPEGKNDTRFAQISTGNFLKQNNTYAAMIIDNFGKKKVARIAWATFN